MHGGIIREEGALPYLNAKQRSARAPSRLVQSQARIMATIDDQFGQGYSS